MLYYKLKKGLIEPEDVKSASCYVTLLPAGGIAHVWKHKLNFTTECFERALKMAQPLEKDTLPIIMEQLLTKIK